MLLKSIYKLEKFKTSVKNDLLTKIKEETKIVNSNSPAIMFPYVRAFISTLTTNLGNVTGPLLIPTQFFRGELEEVVESEN